MCVCVRVSVQCTLCTFVCLFASLCELMFVGLYKLFYRHKCSTITIISLIILFIRGQLFRTLLLLLLFFSCLTFHCSMFASRFDFMKRIFSDFILLHNVFNVRVYHDHKLPHKTLFGGMLSAGDYISLLHFCPFYVLRHSFTHHFLHTHSHTMRFISCVCAD